MIISYFTLSGIKHTIELSDFSQFFDLKNKIKLSHNFYNNIYIYIYFNNQLKNNYDYITENNYTIVFIDRFSDLKYRLRSNLDLNISSFDEFIIIKFNLDLDLLTHFHIIIDYVISKFFNNSSISKKILIEQFCIDIVSLYDFKMISLLTSLNYSLTLSNNFSICDFAAGNSDLNILKFLYEIKHFPLTLKSFHFPIIYNYIHIIKYLILHHCDYDIYIYKLAIKYNKLHFIKFFDRKDLRINKNWDNKLYKYAINEGSSLSFLKYFYKKKYNFFNFKLFNISSYKLFKYTFINNSFTVVSNIFDNDDDCKFFKHKEFQRKLNLKFLCSILKKHNL